MTPPVRHLVIDRLAYGGEGVGRVDGKVIFVSGAVPGDEVSVRRTVDHGRFERAEIIDVARSSPDRIDPACTVFGQCGGCQWQHLKYEAQLRWKREILLDSLSRIAKLSAPDVLPMIAAPDPWHYRRRVRVKIDRKGRLGFYASKSHDVIPFDVCLIADPRVNQCLSEMKQDPQLLKQEKEFEVSWDGSRMEMTDVSDPAFSQVNPSQNARLVEVVLQMAFGNADPVFTRKKTVLELFAGSGNFTFPLAERAGRVIAVEASSASVKEGLRVTQERQIERVTWVEGTAEWGLKKIMRQKTQVDLLVLDPPRKGAREILDYIPLIKPRGIVYVSCDPTTLARDLKELVRRHYRLEKVQPIDMFPQTYHIEAVAALSPAGL